MRQLTLSRLWEIITAILAWFGLVFQLYILVDNVPGNGLTVSGAIGRFFIFFTILTNLAAAISVSFLLLRSKSRLGKFFQRPNTIAAISLYIFVVMLVYNLVLRRLFPLSGRDAIVNEILHVIVPLLYIGYWMIFVRKGTLRWRHAIYWLIYPGVYLIYALLRGKLEGFYAYPFLHVERLGWTKVLLNCAGLSLVFLAGGLLVVFLDRRLFRKRN